MRVLLDNGTPRGVTAALSGHVVEEARARGWVSLANGELLDAAESAGFDVFVTTDRNIRYQQNLTHRRIAVVVLGRRGRRCAAGQRVRSRHSGSRPMMPIARGESAPRAAPPEVSRHGRVGVTVTYLAGLGVRSYGQLFQRQAAQSIDV